MAGRHAERAGDRVHVEADRHRVEGERGRGRSLRAPRAARCRARSRRCGSQWPPTCSHSPTRGCRVSSSLRRCRVDDHRARRSGGRARTSGPSRRDGRPGRPRNAYLIAASAGGASGIAVTTATASACRPGAIAVDRAPACAASERDRLGRAEPEQVLVGVADQRRAAEPVVDELAVAGQPAHDRDRYAAAACP